MSKMDEQRKWKNVCIKEGGREGRKEGRKEEYRRLNRVTDEAKKECLRELHDEIVEFQRTDVI